MTRKYALGYKSHVPDIKTRGGLYEWLEANMARSYEEILEDQKLEPEQNLVKTYIIESNISPRYLPRILRGVFETVRVVPLDDYRFYRLDIQDITKKEPLRVNFFIDAKDIRFWRVFSLQKSMETDNAYGKFVNQIKSRLDKLWLPNSILKEVSNSTFKEVHLRSMSIKHDETPISTEEERKENRIGRLKIEGSGDIGTEIIEFIMQQDVFKHMLRVTKVGIKLIDRDKRDRFVLEDLYYWGKFTVKGTSIEEHLEFVDGIVSKYKDKLKYLEDSLIDYTSVDWEKKIPLVYEFKKEVLNLETFVKAIITPREPFRIWGLAKQVEKDMYIIVGTDLHNGDKFSMEITPWWARLYLPKGSCGNTALRLLTNIQQSYDAQTSLEVPQYGLKIR